MDKADIVSRYFYLKIIGKSYYSYVNEVDSWVRGCID